MTKATPSAPMSRPVSSGIWLVRTRTSTATTTNSAMTLPIVTGGMRCLLLEPVRQDVQLPDDRTAPAGERDHQRLPRSAPERLRRVELVQPGGRRVDVEGRLAGRGQRQPPARGRR